MLKICKKRVKYSFLFACDLDREIVSFASFSFRKEKRKEVKMKTQDEVVKSAEMCVIGAILIDEKALAAGDPAGLVAAELK